MKFAFVLAEKAVWPVSVMCEVLGVSRSGYYAWQGRPASARDQEDGKLVVAIKAAHKVGRGNYGSPRVHRALRKNGTRVGKKRVARLMRREGIVAKRRKKFRITTDSNHTDPIAPNILNREFNIAQPNTAWVTDVSVPQISGVEDEGRSLAIGLQEQIANHRKRLGSKALVVSVAEKVP
jgi:transposase InsO family protein